MPSCLSSAPKPSRGAHSDLRAAKRIAFAAVAVLASLAPPLVAQDAPSIDKFRVLLRSGERIEGTNGALTRSDLRGQLSNGRDTIIARADLRSIDISNGSQVAKGAGIGAGIAGLSAITGILQAKADPQLSVDNSRVGPVIIAFTAVGALVGAAIGSTFDRWERVSLTVSPLVASSPRVGPALRYSIPTP